MTSRPLFQHCNHLGSSLKNGIRGFFTEYETPKLVLIHSSTYGILLRIMQILILTYSIIYVLIYDKGYQKQDTAIISSVTLKVKGIGYIHTSRNKTIVFDVADYIIPPTENNAIFIMTNFVQTDQNLSICSELATLKEAICEKDSDCQNRPFSPKINGRWTGQCILSPKTQISNETMNITKISTGLCEYAGWCPAEDDRSPPMLVKEVFNFTLFIKNFIEFPAFSVKHKNMIDELKSCIFDAKNYKDCPIYTIDYIINQAEKDLEERNLMLLYGGVIRIKLDWDCNLDHKIKLCKPTYSFARLDVPYRDRPFSVGFNFRYASYWKSNGTNYRLLTKAYVLRLIIAVSGKAGKLDLITFTLNIGSVVGIFGLATFICDIILLHVSKQARIYRNHVFEIVHLRTRMQSVMYPTTNHIRDEYKHLNSESNETFTGIGKTVNIRPLTLINSEQLTISESI